MKKIVSFLSSLAIVASSLLVAAPVQASAPNWDVTGSYVANVNYLGTDYPETLVLHQSGALIDGTSLDLVGGGSPFTIDSGSVSGNTIDFEAFNNGNPSLRVHFTGAIQLNGSMNGTWYDSAGGSRTGTWATTSGAAVVVSAPSVPQITTPSSSICTTTADQQLIDWTDSTGTGPITYQYQAYSDSAYTALLYDSGMTLSASQIPTPGTPAGTYYIRVRAQNAYGTSDWSNGPLNPLSITVSNTFHWSALLSPLNISGKTYKQGSTIPIKVQILNGCGKAANMGMPTLTITGPSPAVTTVVVDPFRYDVSGQQYISNWSTKTPTLLANGTYTITVGVGTVTGVTGPLPTATVTLVK